MRASSQGGFSITLSMPSAAARATTAGDSEPVISRTGMPMPRARNVSTSSRPVIFGIWLSRIRHAGLCIAVFRNSAAEANVSTGCPITSSRNRNESRTSGSSSTTATAQWSTSFKTLFAVAQGPRACRELPYRLAPDERGVATARPVLERAGASASSLPISAWSSFDRLLLHSKLHVFNRQLPICAAQRQLGGHIGALLASRRRCAELARSNHHCGPHLSPTTGHGGIITRFSRVLARKCHAIEFS